MEEKLEYDELVKLGKELYSKVEMYQVKISEYAVAACDIRHGGISTGLYTLKDYARDIEMPYKTLQNWVQIYRNVVQKLDCKVVTLSDWQKVRKTNDIISIETTAKNKAEGTNRRRRNISCPADRVKSIYNSMQDDEKPFILELTRITQSTKYCDNVLSKRDLNIADDASLIHLMELLDSASDRINNHLTAKAKQNRYA